MEKMILEPIGVIYTPYEQGAGTPIQPAYAGDAEGRVEVCERYVEGLKDLDGFERVWLIYWLDRAKDFRLRVVPYRDTRERGLFATRAPMRPNPIGMSPVRLKRVEGNILYISEMDILNETPLLDIKPYSSQFDAFETERNGWLDDSETQRDRADERFHE